MRAVKVGPDRWRVEPRHGDQNYRRVKTSLEIVAFLIGGLPAESNLGAGHGEITFKKFADDIYLPLDAERRLKDSSMRREKEMLKALEQYFAEMPLHMITRADWDKYQKGRTSGELSPKKRVCGPSVILKEFKCLRSVLIYAETNGYVRRNVLVALKPGRLGLYDKRRAEIWLTKDEIKMLLKELPPHLQVYFEFIIWTGARPDEACQFGRANISADGKEIWIVIGKRRKRDEDKPRVRRFRVASLGPRFQELLQGLVPHPVTGLFFCNPETGERYVARYLQIAFKKAVKEAKLSRRVVPYDLRGTFAMHRAMVLKRFRQLQSEMGHLDPKSLENYLAEASKCDPRESIFYGVDTSWEGEK